MAGASCKSGVFPLQGGMNVPPQPEWLMVSSTVFVIALRRGAPDFTKRQALALLHSQVLDQREGMHLRHWDCHQILISFFHMASRGGRMVSHH